MRVRSAATVSTALMLAVGALAGCAPSRHDGVASATGKTPKVASTATFRGFPLSVPFDRPQVTLTDTGGSPYPFATRTRDHVTLVYLGYTHCADTCPAVMADIATALREIARPIARQVTVVFITTDPARDTGAVIRRWLDRFNPSFVGLTGGRAALAGAYAAFGVNPKVVRGPDGAEQVEHGADVFAFGTNDRAVLSFDPDATPADYRNDLALLVAGRTPAPPSAAQLAQTGGAGRAGLVELFNARLVDGVAGEVQLQLTALNNGDSTDAITGVTGPAPGVSVSFQRGGGFARQLPLPPGVPVTLGGRDRITLRGLRHAGPLAQLTLLLANGARLPVTVPFTRGSTGK